MAIVDRSELHRLVDELPDASVAPAEDALTSLRSPEDAESWRLAQLVGPDLDRADRELAEGSARGMPWATVRAVLHAPDPDAALDAFDAEWDSEPVSAEEQRQVEASERAIAAGDRLLTTAEVEAEIEAGAAREAR